MADGVLGSFVGLLVASGLLSREEILDFVRVHKEQVAGSPEKLAQELVRTRRLTRQQASALCQAKTKGQLFGEYLVLEEGTLGSPLRYFRAIHRPSGRIVALKVISTAEMDSTSGNRLFGRECEICARLDHPHILAFVETGEVDSRKYFALQDFNRDENLESLVSARGPLPIQEALHYIRQVISGLEYLHGQGVLHGNIKPQLMLVDAAGHVRIRDFHSASLLSDEPGTAHGCTPAYMPPEQVQHSRSRRTVAFELYSLGCSLFELLTGAPPFPGENIKMTIKMHVEAPVPLLRSRRPDASLELEAILCRLMAKRPEDRFSSATELLGAIKNL